MPGHQCKNSHCQDNTSFLEPRNPTTVGPENFNIAEKQDTDLKTASMTMVEVLKEE